METKKKFPVMLIGLVICQVAVVILVLSIIQYRAKLFNSLTQVDNIQFEIDTLKLDMAEKDKQLNQANTDLQMTRNQLLSANSKITNLESENIRINNELKSVKIDKDNLNIRTQILVCEEDDLNMDYLNNSVAALRLQNYVSTLHDVKSVSYVIPEKIYSNTRSQLYHITYVSSGDGKVYSKRYIVFVNELGWGPGTFSIDGQCWIDPPY
jgi:hypothetical protein